MRQVRRRQLPEPWSNLRAGKHDRLATRLRQRLELIPASDTEFFLRSTAGRMVFQLDGDQYPQSLTFYLGGKTYTARRVD